MHNRQEILNRIITAVQLDPRVIGLVNTGLPIKNHNDQGADIELTLILCDDDFIDFSKELEDWAGQFGPLLLANFEEIGHSWMVYDWHPLPTRIDFNFLQFSKIDKIKNLLNFNSKGEDIVYYAQAGSHLSQQVAVIVNRSTAPEIKQQEFAQACRDFWYSILRTHKNLLRNHTCSARYDFNTGVLGNLMVLVHLEIRSKVNWRELNSADGIEPVLSSWRKEQLDKCIPSGSYNDLGINLANVARLGYEICDSVANENQWAWPSELAEILITKLNMKVKTIINLPSVTYQPIGYVKNDINELLAPDKIKAVQSQIIIDSLLERGLEGLHAGQKIMVVFHLHRSKGYELRQHPRRNLNLPAQGVFALHSPQRPNSIGVTIVDLLAIEGNILTVHGLDAINTTPVLDLKLE